MPEISISQAERDKVLRVRKAVDAYREAHSLIHSVPWHKGVPEEHTAPLLQLKKALVELGYKEEAALNDAFTDSDLLNIQELGFTDRDDFEARATEADKLALEEEWH